MQSQKEKPKIQLPKKKSKHPSNQFLIDDFQILSKKSKDLGTNQHFNYDKLIKALQQYPLPVLTHKQALSINGVGDKTATIIVGKIQKKYGDLIKNVHELDEDEIFEKFNDIEEQLQSQDNNEEIKDIIEIDGKKFVYDADIQNYKEIQQTQKDEINSKKNVKRNLEDFKNENKEFFNNLKQGKEKNQNLQKLKKDKISKQNSQVNKKNNKILVINNDSQENLSSQNSLDEESCTQNSNDQKIKKRQYNPKQESGGWSILVAFYKFNQDQNKMIANKNDLRQQVKKLEQDNWKLNLNNFNALKSLKEHNLIEEWAIGGEQKLQLTQEGLEKGKKFFNLYLEKIKINESDNQILETDEESDILQNKNLSKKNSNKINDKKRSNPTKNNNNSLDNSIDTLNQNLNNESVDLEEEDDDTIKVQKGLIEDFEIHLIIDDREKKGQSDHTYFHTKLSQYLDPTPGVDTLPIGDFVWSVQIMYKDREIPDDDFVLDTIIERKTANDLAASILDKRYKDQKNRLKQTKFKNIMYLVEDRLTQNNIKSLNGGQPLTQSTIDQAILSIRIKDKFKVKQTASIQESIKWLAAMTRTLKQRFRALFNRLQDDEFLEFQYTYKDFQQNHAKHKIINIKNQLGYMIFQINKSGDNAARQITGLAKTPLKLYQYLIQTREVCLKSLEKFKNKKKSLFDLMVKELREQGKMQDKGKQQRQMGQEVAETIIHLFLDKKLVNDQTFNYKENIALSQNIGKTQFINLSKKKIQSQQNNNLQFSDFKNINSIINNNKPNKNTLLSKNNFNINNNKSQNKSKIQIHNSYDDEEEEFDEDEEENIIKNVNIQNFQKKNQVNNSKYEFLQKYKNAIDQDNQFEDQENFKNYDNIKQNLFNKNNNILQIGNSPIKIKYKQDCKQQSQYQRNQWQHDYTHDEYTQVLKEILSSDDEINDLE